MPSEALAAGASSIIRARALVKNFGHVRALDGANLDVRAHEIHAVIGDNGAGKSTLIKILAGVITPDGGNLEFEGEDIRFHNPRAAQMVGIETVYQDLSLAPALDASDNMFVGREIFRLGWRGRLGLLDRHQMRLETASYLRDLGIDLPSVRTSIERLSGGQRQAVAVARAAMWGRRLLILDEPTAALAVTQTRLVLDLLRRAREKGLAILLISHDLPQVLEVADRVTVMRLGRRVLEADVASISHETLLASMSGLSEVAGQERRQ